MPARKVCIVGSGNWGSAISRLVGYNTARMPNEFHWEVKMWVFEEMVNGKKLTEIINTTHENVKYLPDRILPENILAEPDIVAATFDADLIIFVLPHEFIPRTCQNLIGKIKSTAQGISLIKGVLPRPESGIQLVSSVITGILHIPVSVLMGANIANDVADEKIAEATIGCTDLIIGDMFKLLFNTDNFIVTVVCDKNTVEICGALKNIVACASGFCDGMKVGNNTKAAIIRLGLKEMVSFAETFYPGGNLSTFFESCGIADLITTCFGGRNRKVSEAFVTSNKSIEELETSMLNGQKLQGPETAAEVNYMLKKNNMEALFPIFSQVHKICSKKAEPCSIIEAIKNHPTYQVDMTCNSGPKAEDDSIVESITKI